MGTLPLQESPATSEQSKPSARRHCSAPASSKGTPRRALRVENCSVQVL